MIVFIISTLSDNVLKYNDEFKSIIHTLISALSDQCK